AAVNATIDGVVRIHSAFSMTLAFLPSITATQELVVPRSMPMTLLMLTSFKSGTGRPGKAAPPRSPGKDEVDSAIIAEPTRVIYVAGPPPPTGPVPRFFMRETKLRGILYSRYLLRLPAVLPPRFL